MDGYGGVLSDWSWGENKLFELALAVIEEDNPDRWKLISAMVGGKSEEEVEKHYRMLLDDLQSIESGKLDHTFGGDAPPQLYLSIECTTQSVCWTDEDQKMLVRLDINSSAKEGEKRALSI